VALKLHYLISIGRYLGLGTGIGKIGVENLKVKQLNKKEKQVMNLVRFYNPRYSVNRNLVDEMYNNFLKNDYHENYVKNCANQPATNIFETEKDFKLEMLLPGFAKEDVQINYHKNLLTIKVDKEQQKENEHEEFKFEHREFGKFNFEKNFKIPNSVNIESVDAKFENGILSIVLPKKEEALEKAPVEIKVS
jgi:HSP20 family protein